MQTIESGKGFLKEDYDPNKENQTSLWLSERLKKKKEKIRDQFNGVEARAP